MSLVEAYSRLSYSMWYALAEFIDNSTQSRLNYGSIIDQVLQQERSPLIVEIDHHMPAEEERLRRIRRQQELDASASIPLERPALEKRCPTSDCAFESADSPEALADRSEEQPFEARKELGVAGIRVAFAPERVPKDRPSAQLLRSWASPRHQGFMDVTCGR